MHAQSPIIVITIRSDTFHFCSLLRSISFHPLYCTLHSFSAFRLCIQEWFFNFLLLTLLSKLFISLNCSIFGRMLHLLPHFICATQCFYMCSFQWVTNWMLCNVISSNPHNVEKMLLAFALNCHWCHFIHRT